MSSEEPFLLLETLSERVLRHRSPTVWRKLFLRPHQEVMQFAPAQGTVLCAILPASETSGAAQPQADDLALLAACHGGQVDPCPEGCALVRFEQARAAFEMALELQQWPGAQHVQVGLASGACTLALLAVDDGPLRMMVGDTVDRAAALARLAAPGAIRMAPDTFGELRDAFVDMSRGILTTEYEREVMIAVSLRLATSSAANLSNFAGLGLT